MSNIFLLAKKLRKKHPGKSWQQLVKMASKEKKVGAYKVIEQGETKKTPVKKTVQTVRSKKGTFKGYKKVGATKKHTDTLSHNVTVSVGSIKKHYEQKLQKALWEYEKAKTVKATKAARKKITAARAMLKKI